MIKRIILYLFDGAMKLVSLVVLPVFWLLAVTLGRRQHQKDLTE